MRQTNIRIQILVISYMNLSLFKMENQESVKESQVLLIANSRTQQMRMILIPKKWINRMKNSLMNFLYMIRHNREIINIKKNKKKNKKIYKLSKNNMITI